MSEWVERVTTAITDGDDDPHGFLNLHRIDPCPCHSPIHPLHGDKSYSFSPPRAGCHHHLRGGGCSHFCLCHHFKGCIKMQVEMFANVVKENRWHSCSSSHQCPPEECTAAPPPKLQLRVFDGRRYINLFLQKYEFLWSRDCLKDEKSINFLHSLKVTLLNGMLRPLRDAQALPGRQSLTFCLTIFALWTMKEGQWRAPTWLLAGQDTSMPSCECWDAGASQRIYLQQGLPLRYQWVMIMNPDKPLGCLLKCLGQLEAAQAAERKVQKKAPQLVPPSNKGAKGVTAAKPLIEKSAVPKSDLSWTSSNTQPRTSGPPPSTNRGPPRLFRNSGCLPGWTWGCLQDGQSLALFWVSSARTLCQRLSSST